MDINLNRRLLYIIPVFQLTFASMLKGGPMVQVLLLCIMLFQAGTPTATKPIIDNERVSVQDVSATPHQRSQLTLLLFPFQVARYMCRKELPRISPGAHL